MQIVNSIVMNHVTIGDGCSIQGSVVCSNVQLQERVVLKDCQVLSLLVSFSHAHVCMQMDASPHVHAEACMSINSLVVLW